MRSRNEKFFTGFKHCGSEKVWMIEGQGINAPAFASYKAAANYRDKHNIGKHRIFLAELQLLWECVMTRFIRI